MPRYGSSDGPPLSKEELQVAARTLDEQLKRAQANADLLRERSGEYDALKGILEKMPGKLTHPIMVPFGPLAFFPGHVEHTNEVLTQLSGEWFALQTTQQALGVVARRKARIRRDQNDVDRELRELRAKRGLASGEDTGMGGVEGATVRLDEEGFMEIREPYPDDGMDPVLPTPAADAAAAADQGASASLLSKLREMERLEELEALEELDEGREDAVPVPVEHDALPMPQQPPVAQSPADIFSVMRRAEESSASAATMPLPSPLPVQAGGAPLLPPGTPAPKPASGDSTGTADAPKRISKFKAERQRMRGE